MNTDKKYQVIYADPPWHYVNTNYDKFVQAVVDKRNNGVINPYGKKINAQIENHYPTMSTLDIMNLPISNIADKDCALFMWTTNTHLPQAIEVIKAWGFTYKTIGFNWIKKYPNGNFRVLPSPWTNGGSELCLFATKGAMSKYKKDHKIKQVLEDTLFKHSQKPQEVADRIVRMFPDCTRIELFARDAKPGWDVWGNEIENTIEL